MKTKQIRECRDPDRAGSNRKSRLIRLPSTRRFGFSAWRVFAILLVVSSSLAIPPTLLAQPAAIVLQPASQQIYAGTPVAMSVVASGAAPLRYQWRKNGANLPGQTNYDLLFEKPQPADTGSYQVEALGNPGIVLSQVARLQVNARSAPSMPVTVFGWDEGVVIDNAGGEFITEWFDDYNDCWFEAGFQGHADGFPSSGIFTSAANSNVIFQLQSYDDYNVLRLDSTIEGATGFLLLGQPGAYSSISILAGSGGGSGSGQLTLCFSDGTASPPLPFIAYDWYTNNPAIMAIAGLGRAYYTSPQFYYDTRGPFFGLFETDFDLKALGLSEKNLVAIAFSKPSPPQATSIFAVSGAPNKSAKPPPPIPAITISVAATSNPWLAGMPDGSVSYHGDVAPAESPDEVLGLPLTPGDTLSFQAVGGVTFDPSYGFYPPDGFLTRIVSRTPGAENGISDILAPIDALIGVFLGPDQPNLSPAPARLAFSALGSRNYQMLEPALKQVFYIGDGVTSGLKARRVVVPHGATRLFLGSLDSYGWANNFGGFLATVGEANPLQLGIAPQTGGGFGLSINASLGFTNLIQSTDALGGSNWSTLTNLVVAASPYTFVDSSSPGTSNRFYRVLQLP